MKAELITVPDVPAGTEYRLAFVTSDTTGAFRIDVGFYNAFVTSQANQSSALFDLQTTWTAILSTVTLSAIDNTNTVPTIPNIPIFGFDGIRIANDYADLWDGTINSSIHLTQNGLDKTGASIWSGSLSNGLRVPFGMPGDTLNGCYSGIAGVEDARWIHDRILPLFESSSVYGISGVLTAVPEPGSSLLLGVVGWWVIWTRAKRT